MRHIHKKHFLFHIFVLSFLLIYACERAGPVEKKETSEATFGNIQTSIFDQSCALSGCHLDNSAPFGLDLSQGQSYANLVNVQSQEVSSLLRVEPGNADSSYIILKLEGASIIEGERMPLGREPLPAKRIDQIRRWIKNGAPNN